VDAILSYLHALWKLARGGFKFATPEQAEERFKICEQCELYDHQLMACKECGCGLSPYVGGFRRLFEKTTFPQEECPLKKWGKIT